MHDHRPALRVRYLLVTRPELVSPVLGVYQRVLFAWQRLRARRAGVEKPLPGSITAIQRFGDTLNLHFHSFLPDGRTMLLLEPVELLRRLANFVPGKVQNLVRYHGVFAPNSKHRSALALLAARTTLGPLPPGEGGRPEARPGEGTVKTISPPARADEAEAPLEVRPAASTGPTS